MNRKGFTLVELLGSLVILGIIVSIGGVAITKTIKNTKEKNYNIVVANIRSAVETYYQECTYSSTISDCSNTVKISTLINLGFIKPNEGQKLVNPKDETLQFCSATYDYEATSNNLAVDITTALVNNTDC